MNLFWISSLQGRQGVDRLSSVEDEPCRSNEVPLGGIRNSGCLRPE
jgi:hypothetical protein